MSSLDAVRDENRKEVIRGRLLQRHPHLMGFVSDPSVEVFAVKAESFLLLVGLTDAYFETAA